jgi:predicted Zn-dependent peptidase
MHALAFVRDPDAAVDAAWRVIVHGADHPYAAAGALRAINFAMLDAGAAAAFRARRYRADAMTIIIAGGFDPKLAGTWIEYQFATWAVETSGAPRGGEPARVSPAALAVYDDTTMVQLRVALPAAGGREHLLVAAELIDQTIADVRHQLGAAYALSASVEIARLSTSIRIAGHVDAARAADAIALVRDRLAALRAPDAGIASRFVAARRRVAARLQALETRSAALADLAERDVVAGRPVGSDFELAGRVRRLTLRDLAPTLQHLELARGALLLRGPQPAVDAAYRVLGHTPQLIDAAR